MFLLLNLQNIYILSFIANFLEEYVVNVIGMLYFGVIVICRELDLGHILSHNGKLYNQPSECKLQFQLEFSPHQARMIITLFWEMTETLTIVQVFQTSSVNRSNYLEVSVWWCLIYCIFCFGMKVLIFSLIPFATIFCECMSHLHTKEGCQ